MSDYTDYIDQHVRCYTVPTVPAMSQSPRGSGERQRQPGCIHGVAGAGRQPISPEGQTIKAIGAPYEGWCLVLDTETTTDTAQALRFGFYALHGISRDERMRLYRAGRLTREMLDAPHSAGLFYNPATLTADDIALLQQYAQLHDLECMTRDAFITTVFYPWVYRYGALLIGHNLPFDLGALATRWADATGGFRGGFSLTLCSCGHAQCFNHPPVRVKMLGRMKALIRFGRIAAPTKTGRQYRRAATGKFLDTATLGRALVGPGDSSLAGLGLVLVWTRTCAKRTRPCTGRR